MYSGCGNEGGGQKWISSGTVSSPAARLSNF